MRLANLTDMVLRGGHLSDRALIEVCMAGERPLHMDRCDICAERAVEFGRWLDDVRAVGDADVDAVFPAERLAAQQAQIMRKLEQIDQPARVIAFPKHFRLDGHQPQGLRVAPGWVAVALAAGLILGIVGDHWGARASVPQAPATVTAQVSGVDAAHQAAIERADQDADHQRFESIETLDQATPRVMPESSQNSVYLAAFRTVGSRVK